MKFKRIKTTFFLVTRKRQYVLQFTLILTCPSYFDGEGVGTIYIPIKYCPECGRKLGKKV